MSLILQLKEYLKADGGWIAKGQLEIIEWRSKKGTRYIPENVGRRLRELAADGILEVQGAGKSVEYRWKPQIKRVVDYVLEWDVKGNPVRRPVVREILV